MENVVEFGFTHQVAAQPLHETKLVFGSRQALFQFFGLRHDHIIPPLERTLRAKAKMCSDPGMAHPQPSQPDSLHSLENLLAETRAAARDQLHTASQLQIDRLHEQIESTWHADLQGILDEGLADAAARIEHWYETEAGSRLADVAAKARANARRDLAEQLGRAVRRLRQFESEDQWTQALLEGTRGFCERAALFIVKGQSLELKAAREFENPTLDGVSLASAPAFASAVETKDTVVAMRTRSELSDGVAALVGESASARSMLFPLTARDRVPAILYADSRKEEPEPAAIEMLCAVASSVLESLAASPGPASGALINIVQPKPEAARPSTWFSLNREEQNVHLRAQRFARVQVAQMRLHKTHAVKAGRSDRNLYGHLKAEIDSGREAFRRDFLRASDSMVDYFHLELVRTLANDDAALLGADYPGPAV